VSQTPDVIFTWEMVIKMVCVYEAAVAAM